MKFVGFFLVAVFLSACATTQEEKSGGSFYAVVERVLAAPPSLRYFLKEGPFNYTIKDDFVIRVNSKEVITADYYRSEHNDLAPLVIFQHGNKAHRGVHAQQARRLASWGFHCLSVEQPNQNRWVQNGQTLTDLVKMLARWPKLLESRFNPSQIILVGHSFGGSAASIATGQGAPVAGLVLLDPALVSDAVKEYLKNINSPTILLGADPKVFKSRRRETFFNLISSEMLEVSISGATHNDAQYPNLFDWRQTIGLKPNPTKDKQELFLSTLVTSIFSLIATDSTELAWDAVKENDQRFIAIKRKN